MPETIQIIIQINLEGQRKISIPEATEVSRNTIVQWVLQFARDGQSSNPQHNLLYVSEFVLYFPAASPFGWKQRSLLIDNRFFSSPFKDAMPLAEDVADTPGKYKYGVKIVDPVTNAPIYDEDPFLYVK